MTYTLLPPNDPRVLSGIAEFNIEIFNSFLVNFIESQKNIVHLKFKNLKKSFLLTFLNKTLQYSFEKWNWYIYGQIISHDKKK